MLHNTHWLHSTRHTDCTIQQDTLTAQYNKTRWLHNTARHTDCTIQQDTLTAAQYSKGHSLLHDAARDTDCWHWLLQDTTRDTDCCTMQQETLTAQYNKRHRLRQNTAGDADCCRIQQETLTSVVVVAFSSRARILGECSTIHSTILLHST